MKKAKLLFLFPFLSIGLFSCDNKPNSSSLSDEDESSEISLFNSSESSESTSIDSKQSLIDSLEWKYNGKYHYKEYNGEILLKEEHEHPDTGTYAYYQRGGCRICGYTSINTGPAYENGKDKNFTSFDELSSFFAGDYLKEEGNKPFDILSPKNIVEDKDATFNFHYENCVDGVYTNGSVNESFYVFDKEKSADETKYSFKVDAFFVVSPLYGERTSTITYKVIENDGSFEIQTYYGKTIYGKAVITPNCNATSDYYLNYVKSNMVAKGEKQKA